MQKFALVLSGSKTITITAVCADSAADSELAWHEQLRRPKNGAPASRPRPPRRQTEPPESLPQRQSPPHEARAVRSSERGSAGGGHRAGPLQPSRGGAGGDDARVCVSRGGQPSTVRGEQDGSLDFSCRLAALEAKVAGWGALPQVRLPDMRLWARAPSPRASGHEAWTFCAAAVPCSVPLVRPQCMCKSHYIDHSGVRGLHRQPEHSHYPSRTLGASLLHHPLECCGRGLGHR